jgi:hypothetical protein
VSRDARGALARHERGHLQLGARRAISSALGGRDDGGRRARTTLARRIFCLWWLAEAVPAAARATI